jgi:hypothetical protein
VIKAWSVIGLLLPIALSGQSVGLLPDQPDNEGTLEISFITSFGEPIADGPKVLVEKVVTDKPVGEWTVQRKTSLKYGTYHLKAQYSGFYPVEKDVRIDQPHQAVLICFFVAPIESVGEVSLVRGHISEGSVKNDCRLIRFMSPFADGIAKDTTASQAGDFGVENLKPGRYFVITLGSHGICETSEAVILFGERVKDLSLTWSVHLN